MFFVFFFHGRATNKIVFFPEESYIRHSEFTVISKAVIKFIRDRRPIYCEVQHCRLSQFSKNDGELVSSIVESHEVSSVLNFFCFFTLRLSCWRDISRGQR